MIVSLNRVILYVQDVDKLADFYRSAFGLPVIEEIKGEWAVLGAGACELALHRVGEAYRVADPSSWKVESNAKLVMQVDRGLTELRAELIAKGVPMGEIKSYPGLTGPLCDGRDPEGNVFQLSLVAKT
jgi:catechol-2,3-dioxygenase